MSYLRRQPFSPDRKPGSEKTDMPIFEISHPWCGIFLHCGYCRGWEVRGGLLDLHEPFVRFKIFSERGPVECRGAWPLRKWLPETDYHITPGKYQPWMDLDIADVITAMDLCAECHVQLPKHGYSRLTIL